MDPTRSFEVPNFFRSEPRVDDVLQKFWAGESWAGGIWIDRGLRGPGETFDEALPDVLAPEDGDGVPGSEDGVSTGDLEGGASVDGDQETPFRPGDLADGASVGDGSGWDLKLEERCPGLGPNLEAIGERRLRAIAVLVDRVSP